MEIDEAAINTANKALSVIFIILTCLANFILIGIQVVRRRKSQFYLNPKIMTILSLAIGDVVLALFALVVMATFFFNQYSVKLDFRLSATYLTYWFCLIHFVYGMGLVTLGAIELCRHRYHSLFTKPGVAIVTGGIPWFLGLVIDLPLCIVNTDFESYYKNKNGIFIQHSPNLVIGVSVLFPACLAVVSLIIFQIIHVKNRRAQQMTSSQHQMSYNKQANLDNQQNKSKVHVGGGGMGVQDNQMYSHHGENPGASIQSYQPYSQHPLTEQCVTQPTYQHLNMQQQNTVYINATHRPVTTISPVTNPMSDMMKLLIIAVVFFIMVVPFPAFLLDWIHSNEQSPNEVIMTVFQWLLIARSCVTPLIMVTA